MGRIEGGLSYLVVALPHSINPDTYWGARTCGCWAAGMET